MKNQFHPNRMTKGNCTFCTYPIEKYENVHFAYDDKNQQNIMHYECARDINHVIIKKSSSI